MSIYTKPDLEQFRSKEKPEGQISPLVLATVLSIALVLGIEFVVWIFGSPQHRVLVHIERSSGTEGFAP